MPAVTVSRTELQKGLGVEYTDTEIEQIVFDFGLELDDVFEENNEIKYKIDVPANRYDLLCLRGLICGIGAYIESKSVPEKKLNIKYIKKEIPGTRHKLRPFVKVAVLKGVDLSGSGYQDLIDLQDKLHQGLGLNRSLMAIGTHDNDKITGTPEYTTMKENEISFVPLNQTREYSREELDTLYKTDGKLKEYLFLSRDSTGVPVIIDQTKKILSLPPLINSEYSKITKDTKNILIEITGTDIPRISTAMHIITYHFSNEETEIEYYITDQETETERAPIELTSEMVKKELLIEPTAETTSKYLKRMMHETQVIENNPETNQWRILVYPSKLRSDILHLCDVIEDVAIAHGYNNFKKILNAPYTIGEEIQINRTCDTFRKECAMIGYTEMFTMALMSKNDYYGYTIGKHIQVKNPKSKECEVLRQHLFPSVLKCILSNQHHQLPLKVFEVSDVCVFDENDTGAKNDKRLVMAIAGLSSGLDDLQEAFDVIMKRQGIFLSYQAQHTEPLLDKRSCVVLYKESPIGALGIVDPKILQQHKLPYVCSMVEISLTKLLALTK
ncbi:phenylalanyl-tRNA synthetase beta chain [Nematocida sp. AWRm80]|nr:phenylalanyl-tRNA synthetase beta chain [Nematocida sp. AWRm80]